MKLKHHLFIAVAACLLATPVLSHEAVPLGPNKGRLLKLSNDDTTHGEVTVKDGKFHIALFDKDLKPVKLDKQSLTAMGGTRQKNQKLTVTKDGDHFVIPELKSGQWLILQFKETDSSKAVTARMHYDTSNCDGCDKPEWLCECKHDDHDHDHDKKADEKKTEKKTEEKKPAEKKSETKKADK